MEHKIKNFLSEKARAKVSSMSEKDLIKYAGRGMVVVGVAMQNGTLPYKEPQTFEEYAFLSVYRELQK